MKQFLEKIKILDSTSLKIIAIISMTIDHTGAVLLDNNHILRAIGRIAMPIFSFCISEGYIHTKNKKKYLARLGIFALISEIPFDLAFYGEIGFRHQNVMFSFFISVIALMIFDFIQGKHGPDETVCSIPRTLLGIFVVFVIGVGSIKLHTDYSIKAVLCIFMFYCLKDSNPWKRKSSGPVFFTLMSEKLYNYFVFFSIIPILMYNGKKGKGLKWLFYIFYPGHLLIIFLIKKIFF